MVDEVILTLKEYRSLLRDSQTLSRLEGAGVDNWEGYHLAFDDEEDELDEDSDNG